MVRKRVIDKPQNLNHNVVPKRAEIGQIITINAVYNADWRPPSDYPTIRLEQR